MLGNNISLVETHTHPIHALFATPQKQTHGYMYSLMQTTTHPCINNENDITKQCEKYINSLFQTKNQGTTYL